VVSVVVSVSAAAVSSLEVVVVLVLLPQAAMDATMDSASNAARSFFRFFMLLSS
jgi:hypothetical protein